MNVEVETGLINQNNIYTNAFYYYDWTGAWQNKTSSPKGNDGSPESNVPTSSHFKQASK